MGTGEQKGQRSEWGQQKIWFLQTWVKYVQCTVNLTISGKLQEDGNCS